ncbi:aldose epimerase family protein [Pseudoxanthobacter sp. M-2]|uniref:aldose epimerase family protein n=1 Tax=Pseudoxanthobacter sp. M-2 TaxID=3078754 RepID=UPI0038FC4754
MTVSTIGTIDGVEIAAVALSLADGTAATVIGFGASVQSLTVPAPEGPRPVVLGYPDLAGYLHNPGYVGTTAGRHANRIGGGRFTLDGRTYQLGLNERGRTHLHGGLRGFSHRPWRLVASDATSATFEIVSPDGEEGYPGTLTARVTYTLAAPATLRVTMTATTDAPTMVGLAHHSYFTLAPGRAVLEHRLAVHAAHITPVDADLIPTGEIAPVAGTPFDLREPRRLADGPRLDHNYVLDATPADDGLHPAATVIGGGLVLTCRTTAPGLQVYDGGGLGVPFFPHAGLCLEPQTFPDGPNKPHFPSPVLRPGETWRQVTEYAFAPET